MGSSEQSLKKVQGAWKKIHEDDLYPSLTEFASIAGVSRRTLIRYSEWHQKVKERFEQKGNNKRKDRTLGKIKDAWKKAVENNWYPSLTEFSSISGVSRRAIRGYPEWNERVKKRYEEKVHEQRKDRTLEKIQEAWRKIVEENLYPSLIEFATISGVSRPTIREYPEWNERVKKRCEEKGHEKRKDRSLRKLEEAWRKVEEDNLYPNVNEFTKIAGVDRNLLKNILNGIRRL